MSSNYKYDTPRPGHLIRHALTILGLSAVIFGGILGVFVWNARNSTQKTGATHLIPQATPQESHLLIDEPDYTMQLPGDWRQTAAQQTASLHTVTWQVMTPGEDNRSLTVYVDTIPTTYAVNRELPLVAHGNRLTYGSISDNCASFTPGGTLNVGQAERLKPAPAIWQGVNFICNLPQVVDNQVGTGSLASINSVAVTGPKAGTHTYFFLYIDRNAEPDDTILYNAIQSFRAK